MKLTRKKKTVLIIAFLLFSQMISITFIAKEFRSVKKKIEWNDSDIRDIREDMELMKMNVNQIEKGLEEIRER